VFQHVRGAAMPQRVRRQVFGQPDSKARTFHDIPRFLPIHSTTTIGQKDRVTIVALDPMVGNQKISTITCEIFLE
jgi:hypothetical protein